MTSAHIYMLWFKFILGLMFLNWFQFYLPLFQIMVMNTWQKKKKLIQFKRFCTKTKFKPQHIYSFVEFQVFTEKKINCSWLHLVIVESIVEEQAHRWRVQPVFVSMTDKLKGMESTVLEVHLTSKYFSIKCTPALFLNTLLLFFLPKCWHFIIFKTWEN